MSVLINVLGAVALLLWGLRMVRTGFMRVYGPVFRQWARQAQGRVFPALLSGFFAAVVLQSSTATAMIAASFSAQGVLSASTAFVIILGADIGTAIAVIVASGKITFISPVFMALGVFGFLASESNKRQNLFRAIAGLGFILLALSLISQSAQSLTQLDGFSEVIQWLQSRAMMMVVFGALLSYLAHSSLAIVLLTAGFYSAGVIDTHSALHLVLGANIGSGLLPVVANWRSRLGARVPVTANLLIRLVGVGIVFVLLDQIIPLLNDIVDAIWLPAALHLVLNSVVALLGLVFSKPLLSLSQAMLPADVETDGFVGPKYLGDKDLVSPAKALASAKREALAMADITQQMVLSVMPALREEDDYIVAKVNAMDDSVDRLFDAIKLYIAQIMQREINAEESQRALDLLSFTANMEHIGDIVDTSLMDQVLRKKKHRVQFSEQGMNEISELHEAVCSNFDLAINTFLSEDSELARQLYDAKAEVRKMEQASVSTHLERIGAGLTESLNTSSMHIDVIRDLKRINSHLTSIAYPVLKASGDVPRTKWKRKHGTSRKNPTY